MVYVSENSGIASWKEEACAFLLSFPPFPPFLPSLLVLEHSSWTKAILVVVGKELFEEVIFDQRPEGSEAIS